MIPLILGGAKDGSSRLLGQSHDITQVLEWSHFFELDSVVICVFST